MEDDLFEWHEFDHWPWKRFRDFLTGKLIDGGVMRRQINGEWQYREKTEDEKRETTLRNAW